MRAAFGEIIEHQPGAAAFEQALRDEDSEPHMVRRAGAGRPSIESPRMLKIDSRTRSLVGRVASSSGPSNLCPRLWPARRLVE